MAEIGTRPGDFARWATDGAADVVEPTESKKDLGWIDDEIPPAEWFNWLAERTYDSLVYLDAHTPRSFTTLSEALIGTETASPYSLGVLIDEFDATVAPLTEEFQYTNAAYAQALGICSDGRWVCTCGDDGAGNGWLRVLDRKTLTSLQVATFAGEPARSVAMAGNYIFTAAGNKVYRHTITYFPGLGISITFAPVLSYDHGAAVNSVASDGAYVFMGGVTSGGVNTHRRLTMGLVVDWSANHGATVYVVKPSVELTSVLVGGVRGAGNFTCRLASYTTGASVGGYDHGAGAVVYDAAIRGQMLYTCGTFGVTALLPVLAFLSLSWSFATFPSSALTLWGDKLVVNNAAAGGIEVLTADSGISLFSPYWTALSGESVLALDNDHFRLFAATIKSAADEVAFRLYLPTPPTWVKGITTGVYRQPIKRFIPLTGSPA